MTAINLTKLDVLSSLDYIDIGVEYRDKSGAILPSVPADLQTLQSVEVVYEALPGWKRDISQVRSWEDLPENAQKYVQRIEELTGVHCKWIGVGPGRDAMVMKPLEKDLPQPHLATPINGL